MYTYSLGEFSVFQISSDCFSLEKKKNGQITVGFMISLRAWGSVTAMPLTGTPTGEYPKVA